MLGPQPTKTSRACPCLPHVLPRRVPLVALSLVAGSFVLPCASCCRSRPRHCLPSPLASDSIALPPLRPHSSCSKTTTTTKQTRDQTKTVTTWAPAEAIPRRGEGLGAASAVRGWAMPRGLRRAALMKLGGRGGAGQAGPGAARGPGAWVGARRECGGPRGRGRGGRNKTDRHRSANKQH